ncbi:MAG: DUF4824 family protein [Gammaproteobacteria bacterium]|nr:DUF4824 family protein [Gammaproteobacteria bacterium]
MSRLAWLAVGLVLAADALALAGVWWNRSETTATVKLTERELPAHYAGPESTALALRIDWNRYDYEDGGLTPEKLEALGFDVSVPAGSPDASLRYRKQLPREAYVVLEYDGRAWRDWIAARREKVAELEHRVSEGEATTAQLEQARRELERALAWHSRLLVVAAGLDPDALREEYRDTGRYLIARGVIAIGHVPGGRDHPARITGHVRSIEPATVHVPPSQRAALVEALGEGAEPGQRHGPYGLYGHPEGGPRYEVTLRYGRRYEPWVEAIAPME